MRILILLVLLTTHQFYAQAKDYKKIKEEFAKFVWKYDPSFNLKDAKILNDNQIRYDKINGVFYQMMFDKNLTPTKSMVRISWFKSLNNYALEPKLVFGDNTNIINELAIIIQDYTKRNPKENRLDLEYVEFNFNQTIYSVPYFHIYSSFIGCTIYNSISHKINIFKDCYLGDF